MSDRQKYERFVAQARFPIINYHSNVFIRGVID